MKNWTHLLKGCGTFRLSLTNKRLKINLFAIYLKYFYFVEKETGGRIEEILQFVAELFGSGFFVAIFGRIFFEVDYMAIQKLYFFSF